VKECQILQLVIVHSKEVLTGEGVYNSKRSAALVILFTRNEYHAILVIEIVDPKQPGRGSSIRRR